MSAQEIEEQIAYYESYINGEMQKGQAEEDVVDSLGDPWAIAKTLMISEEMHGNDYQTPSDEVNSEYDEDSKVHMKSFTLNKVLTFIIIAVILIFGISVVFGLLEIVTRFAMPILMIVLIFNLWKRR